MPSPRKRVAAPQQALATKGAQARMPASLQGDSPATEIAVTVGPVRVTVEVQGRELSEREAYRIREFTEGVATRLWVSYL
ncbi:MAG: hypothetical protein BWX64_00974 [Acidobacteria bacterium ADurb.Bin051]|nr:MAG: hypothetical protein BWX64_00974 [Acidobacteria bacterium ADurb.Bin051]